MWKTSQSEIVFFIAISDHDAVNATWNGTFEYELDRNLEVNLSLKTSWNCIPFFNYGVNELLTIFYKLLLLNQL